VNALLLKRLDLPPDVAAASEVAAAPTTGAAGSPESESPSSRSDDAIRPAA
jgi:hypothetical protein